MLGLHIDLKWSTPKKQYLKRILIQAKRFGIDTILLEFENKIYIDWLKQAIHPDCWRLKDVKWFRELCSELNLTIIPKVPLMGHMEWILQWPWWAHLRENNDFHEICPNHPETPEFVKRLLADVIKLFPDSPIIHLGGDETGSLATCQRCRNTRKSKAQIYIEHYLPLISQVQAAGKRAMIYSDMILAHPKALDDLPRDVIIADWDYWSGTGELNGARVWGYGFVSDKKEFDRSAKSYRKFKKYIFDKTGKPVSFPYVDFLQEQGFDVVIFTSARCGGDNYCVPKSLYHIKNTYAGSIKARGNQCMGTLITSWAVRFNHFETNWPAIFSGAYTYFNPSITIEELSEIFAEQFFGCHWKTCFEDLDLLSDILPDLQSAPHFDGLYADPYPPDIVHRYVKYLYQDSNSQYAKNAKSKLPYVSKKYKKGYKILEKRDSSIRKNKLAYEIWKLSAKTLVHKAEALPVIMNISQGKAVPSGTRAKLLRNIGVLEGKYRQIFGKTFKPISLQMEIDMRFKEERELIASAKKLRSNKQ